MTSSGSQEDQSEGCEELHTIEWTLGVSYKKLQVPSLNMRAAQDE
jgi:hypothetical protein